MLQSTYSFCATLIAKAQVQVRRLFRNWSKGGWDEYLWKCRGVKPCVHVHTHKCLHTLTMQLLARATTVTTQEANFHTPSASIGISALCLYPALLCGRPTHLSRSYHAGCKHIQFESSSLLVWVFHANILILVSCSALGDRTFMKPLNTLIWYVVSPSKQTSKHAHAMQSHQCGAHSGSPQYWATSALLNTNV